MKACKVDMHPPRAHTITLLKLILLKKCYGILLVEFSGMQMVFVPDALLRT